MNDPELREIEGRARLHHLQACVFPVLAEIDDLETHAELLAAPTAANTGASEAWSFGRGTLAKTPPFAGFLTAGTSSWETLMLSAILTEHPPAACSGGPRREPARMVGTAWAGPCDASEAYLWAVSEATGLWHSSKEIKLLGVQHTIRSGQWVKGTIPTSPSERIRRQQMPSFTMVRPRSRRTLPI